ncbi:uncharacterized protein HMPREF1541_00302 [Cyphellophora europaea CBS 101466]|uniref:SANT domain-containing protein n=1 Tax=Cyphellophora europaea (strain CBS 101466) TaxID=1220924 RepID=W2SDK5_CYPE1|nr:uncharacterized protein HMPREF1541_00302 [Cyphellophora europaea CBS 101466]ETN46118.1 hypothetical protein HMPREF1541_00302 [Cyphellophora europaea CBS 101466]
MSRYAPPARDRSPPRYDRRPSNYGAPLGGSSYRGPGEPGGDRDPPRGPRADSFRGGYQYPPPARGRGAGTYASRADTWNSQRDRDRDRERDVRPAQPYRTRDDDRPDWSRRERELGPPERPSAAVRDARPYPPRDRSASPPKARRDSRESLPPLLSRQSDSNPSFRGGLARGRGRGDWDRNRGRSSFVGDRERERDLFSNRSPSREGIWREREYDRGRPAGSDIDRAERFDRRERSRERRDHDIWQRDQSPARISSGPGGRAPSPANSTGHYGPSDRSSKMDFEMTRRPSAVTTSNSLARDARRDADQPDYFPRNELRRETSHTGPYQQPAPQPSATAGLDYGPPPSVPATTPSEKPPSSRPPPTKSVSPMVPQGSFQPPSGPKADRAHQTINQNQKSGISQDSPKPEPPLQPPRVASNTSPTELFPKKMEQKPEPKPPLAQTPDKSMPPNVPSGPRASFGSSFRSRPPLSDSGNSFLTPKAAQGDIRGPAIPTGPRSDRERDVGRDAREGPWPPSQAGTSSRSWISPEYNRAKPSIMSPINRPAFAPTGPRSQSILPPSGEKPRTYPPSIMAGSGPSPAATKSGSTGDVRVANRAPSDQGAVEDVDMSLPVSSDEEADEDDFDEDDFAASEEKYDKERKSLEARKPPPLLHDTVVRGLLIKLQFLNMIANNIVVQSSESKHVADEPMKDVDQPQIGLPSPEELSEEQEKLEVKHPQPRGRPLRQPPVNPIPTPPVEDLPYLKKQNSQPIVFDNSDDEVQHEAVTTLIRQRFEQEAFDWLDELQDMSNEYRKNYISWKQEVAGLELPLRDTHVSPAPASPAPSAAPSVTPSVNHERTRGGRNTTEADLQAAIALSQQTMKEEEERREREAASSSVPNYEHEAVVPPMLEPNEAALLHFEDTNKLIQPEFALEVFAYLPPEDDFTPEEQLAFIQAYCQTPKKWGKIAEALPERSYQDCITHYYLTKGEAKYKDIWRRAQPKRRRGRAAATKPRSTALMSELVYRDGEEGVVAVTDTGRPRRAAAPTFGDTPVDSDPSTVAPAAKRLAVSGKDATAEGVAKPPRGRKGGTTTKSRRTKAQIQAEQQAAQAAQAAHDNFVPTTMVEASPQKVVALKDRSRTLLRAENNLVKPDLMPGLEMHKLAEADITQYGVPETERMMPAIIGHGSNQPTSYWSVPEQQKFPQLISYYGRDFATIAEFMKTKTSTMIKNHYNRQIAEGKTDLEEMAKVAEIKRANNEPMGRPPSPAVQTKRRYEATPSTASSQPGRPLPDQHAPDSDLAAMAVKTSYTEDFPSNAVQRNLTGDLVTKTRPNRELLQDPVLAQSKPEELQRPVSLSHKPHNGPRSGFFKEENPPFGLQHQTLSRDNSPHQHPLRPGEHRYGDLGHVISAGSPRQLNLGPPRDIGGLQSHAQTQVSLLNSSIHNERFGLAQQQHSRSGSLGGRAPSAMEQARDLASLRHLDPMSRPYSMIPPQIATPPPASSVPLRRTESGPDPTPAPPTEPLKPAPAKKSNIASLLNDDPPEQKPNKRSSLDSQKRQSAQRILTETSGLLLEALDRILFVSSNSQAMDLVLLQMRTGWDVTIPVRRAVWVNSEVINHPPALPSTLWCLHLLVAAVYGWKHLAQSKHPPRIIVDRCWAHFHILVQILPLHRSNHYRLIGHSRMLVQQVTLA